MAIPPAHYRFVLNGTLTQNSGGGSEIWDMSFATDGIVAGGVTAAATAVDAAARTSWAASGQNASDWSYYVGTRCQAIDAAGKVSQSGYAAAGAPIQGTNSLMTCTIVGGVLTLITGQRDSKGTLIYGRMYPPAQPANLIGSTFDSTDLNTWVNEWAGFMGNLQTASGGNIVVASSTGLGLVPVSGIRASNVVGTQRRRKNSVTEFLSTVHSL